MSNDEFVGRLCQTPWRFAETPYSYLPFVIPCTPSPCPTNSWVSAVVLGAHASRVLVWKPGRRFASVAAASRRNNLFLVVVRDGRWRAKGKVRDREDALARHSRTRTGCL